MPPFDRILALQATDSLVGIDFVYVAADQLHLYVFFHPSKSKNADLIVGPVAASQVRIFSPSGGDSLPEVLLDQAHPPTWILRDGRTALALKTVQPGDFSRYRLEIHHPQVDPHLASVSFSFKANCPSQLDCKPPPPACAPDALVDFPVNYQARDFWSLRQALLDFASERHPAWKDRLEADLGMMLAEVMSALGDEFSYIQDRVARETSLETATQRRSLRRHARLVDYPLDDGEGGLTWLVFHVNKEVSIPAGTPIWVPPPKAGPMLNPEERLALSESVYEVGLGLIQGRASPPLLPPCHGQADGYDLTPAANELVPHAWDISETCLLAGATSVHVEGHLNALVPLNDFSDPNRPGRWMVLRTHPADAGVPERSWRVRVILIQDETDPLATPSSNVTRLEWDAVHALPFDMEMATLKVHANVVPATAGETFESTFRIAPDGPVTPVTPSPNPSNRYHTKAFSDDAIERQAPPSSGTPADSEWPVYAPSFLIPLPGTEERPLVWLAPDGRPSAPEVRVRHLEGDTWREWEWKRSLLGSNSSKPLDHHFVLDDGSWRRLASYRRVDESGTAQDFQHFDYAEGHGVAVRFGNGEFGKPPERGQSLVVHYRLGNGRAENVAPDTLTDFNKADFPDVATVTNPLGVTNARPAESFARVRQRATQAFREVAYRAVRAEDYAQAVERLDWVQRASAEFRWTGSWLTVFATPDPRHRFVPSASQREDLARQLDRFRLAGREAVGGDPRFANLDLEIEICIAPGYYVGEVKEAALEALFGCRSPVAVAGFFDADNWTFGKPLERPLLEKTLQDVPGVRAVERIRIRRRGWFDLRPFDELIYRVAAHEVIRVENNPLLPEQGSVRLVMEGGA